MITSISYSPFITHEMEIIPIVQYWMPNMRVIEPEWIHDQIMENIKRVCIVNYIHAFLYQLQQVLLHICPIFKMEQ